MKRHLWALGLALAPLTASHAAPAANEPPPAAVQRDPQALQALQNMGKYLRTLPSISISADSLTDTVLDNGQAVQFADHTEAKAVRPDRIRASVSGVDGTREMIYDGKTFTLYGTRTKYYATVPAPATIGELARQLSERYGLETPLGDLFAWGTHADDGADLSSAMKLGTEQIGGNACTHYAFRQSDLDWQLWIREGSRPLPCKLVVTDRTLEAHPQHTILYTWHDNPKFGKDTFRFVPPKGAQRIVLRPWDGSAQNAQTPAKQ
jgi:hypothetical protein